LVSYESVLEVVESTLRARSPQSRDIRWLTDAHVIGVARDSEGSVEVFLSGSELVPRARSIREVMDSRRWHRENAPGLDANRIVFPALGHYDPVAAFICAELIRCGADKSLERAFAETEPIIELAIERLRLSGEVIIGLAGELLLLNAVLGQAQDAQVEKVLDSWHGWRTSSRDFLWEATGVEVKATMRTTSSHLVEGVHQVERHDGSDGGVPEERLFLVSVGLQTSETDGNSFTIPQLVDRVIARLHESGLSGKVDKFLRRLSEYGAGSGRGYDHNTDRDEPGYASPFVTTFFRAYNMDDSAIEVLRRDDVAIHHHVDPSSVSFRVDLPVAVSFGNPINGANQVARSILTGAD